MCDRSSWCLWALRCLGLASWLTLVGCNVPLLRDEPLPTKPVSTVDPDSVQFVRSLARPWGLHAQEVQAVSLVVGLPGTGSDPKPTADRAMLISEMQTRNVERPSEVLAASSTALVLVRGRIPPGARKGQRFDLEVRVPSGSKTTSLLGGWMMQARLREYARIDNRLSSGHVLAHGNGHVLIDSLLEGDDDALLQTRGRILGGGVVAKPRNLGFVLRDQFTSVRTSTHIGHAINGRFHVFDRGSKVGVATPKRDNFIELRVHPRYQDNQLRYIRVIENIAVRETPAALAKRLELLRAQLLNPSSSSLAAVQLEAIGEPGLTVLEDGLAADTPEVQFYAAEALGYLNHPPAVDVLASAARNEPAFRWRGLTALGAMDDIAAHEALIDLMHDRSAETRYGAFRILRKLTPDDPVIRGTVMGEHFLMHVVDSNGPPLVHVAKDERPEIVLFGADHPLQPPVVMFAGSEIVVRSEADGKLRVRKLSAGEEDDELLVAADLKSVIRGIVELGGTYPDVVQALSEAKSSAALASRLEFSAVPETGRVYHRNQADQPHQPAAEVATETTDGADEFGFDTAPASSLAASQKGPRQPQKLAAIPNQQPLDGRQVDPTAVEFDAGGPSRATDVVAELKGQTVTVGSGLSVGDDPFLAQAAAEIEAAHGQSSGKTSGKPVINAAPVLDVQRGARPSINARQPARLNAYSAAPPNVPMAAGSQPSPLSFDPTPAAGGQQPPEPPAATIPQVEFNEPDVGDERVSWDEPRGG